MTENTEIIDKDKKETENAGLKPVPRIAKIFYWSAAGAVVIYVTSMLCEPFADFYNRYIAGIYRAVSAYLTVWLPFSAAELLIVMLPLLAVYLLRFVFRYWTDTWRGVLRAVISLLSIVAVLLTGFVSGIGTGYYGSTLDEKLGLDREVVSAEELYATCLELAEQINANAEQSVSSSGLTLMPYNYNTMSEKLCDAYDIVCEKYPFVQKLHTRVKPVILSKPWTYTHITGIYTFFTGEANININMPDYTIPYTAAHEMAHQRGIAREDEANFVAFLCCLESDDSYIRYSGYLSMYEYVSNSLYSADKTLYYKAKAQLDSTAVNEMAAYSAFFQKYRKNVVATVSNAVNDTFLKSQGTSGSKSYGMVVDLAVAYYRPAGDSGQENQ